MPSLEQKNSNQSHIEKSVRKSRILMKEKCHLIDHQISLNLQKLDSLLGLIQSKKTHFDNLKNIVEAQIEEEIDSQSQKDLRKERRLKFKYSINRQYAFEQNSSTKLMAKDKIVETKDDINFIQSSEEHESMLIEGLGLEQNFISENGQEGAGISLSSQRLAKKSSRLQRFDSLRDSEINDEHNQFESIQIQTRYNWIQRYLNHQLNDTSVKAFNSSGEQIEVIKFNKKQDLFECKLVQENDVFAMSNLTNRSARSVKSTKKSPFITEEYLNYRCKDFLNQNTHVRVEFPSHTCQLKLFSPEKQQVIRLSLQEKDCSVRILLKSENSNASQMQRIMIFKEIPNEFSGQKYKIVWTKYDKESFIEDIVLEGNCNYLITNLCCNPSFELKLILNPSDLHALKIHKTQYDPWRSYNILCSAFEQCSKVFMSENVYDQQKPLEYLRANYLDHGLVLEIYQNVHSQRISITDKNEQKRSEEDIRLLFGEIYTEQQNKNVYEPEELVIKFFEVTEKPARLYYPEKKVLIGNQISEQVTVYSTFK